MGRFWWSYGFGHGLQHSAQIAVGREYCGGVFLKGGAHDIEASQKGIEFLRIRRAECRCVNRGGFGVGFSLDLERVLCRGGTDRCHIAFLLTADVRGLAASLGTEPCGDLMPLARHALDDLLRNRWIVFTALETFIA